MKLKEEMCSCQHFLLDSHIERARHKMFNYAIKTLNATIVDKKLGHLFNKLKFAAKVNRVFGFTLKTMETGDSDLFRHTKTIPC